MPFHAVRTFFLGSIACPKIETRPLGGLEDLWGGEQPEFESLDDTNELLDALINGLWNRLTRHQSRKHPLRLTALRLLTDKASIKRFAETRVEELGDEEAPDLPETAHDALGNLGDVRSFFAGFARFADDHEAPEDTRNRKWYLPSVYSSTARERAVALAAAIESNWYVRLAAER
jgi:hypothetical protein